MKYFPLLLFLFSTIAVGQGTVSSTCIWSGTIADCLPADGLLLRNQRDLRLGEDTTNGSNYVALQAPASIASDYTLTLPADDGDSSEILGTNGSGALDWTLINSPSFFTTGAAATNSAYGVVLPSHTALGATPTTGLNAVRSGTFTPASALLTNLDSNPTVGANSMIWSQSGNVVTCTGYLSVDPTSASAAATFTLTVPVTPASNFAVNTEGMGLVNFSTSGLGSTATIGEVVSTISAKTVTMAFYATDASAGRNFWYQFQYVVN